MEQAGTPCPFEGKIGKEAKEAWKKYIKLRPDHKQYLKNLEMKEKADEQQIKQMTIECEKIEKENKKSQIKNEKNIDWESPK